MWDRLFVILAFAYVGIGLGLVFLTRWLDDSLGHHDHLDRLHHRRRGSLVDLQVVLWDLKRMYDSRRCPGAVGTRHMREDGTPSVPAPTSSPHKEPPPHSLPPMRRPERTAGGGIGRPVGPPPVRRPERTAEGGIGRSAGKRLHVRRARRCVCILVQDRQVVRNAQFADHPDPHPGSTHVGWYDVTVPITHKLGAVERPTFWTLDLRDWFENSDRHFVIVRRKLVSNAARRTGGKCVRQ